MSELQQTISQTTTRQSIYSLLSSTFDRILYTATAIDKPVQSTGEERVLILNLQSIFNPTIQKQQYAARLRQTRKRAQGE